MSATNVSEAAAEQSGDVSSALFAHLVVQQANMAMMMTGKVAHPETGQTMRDLEAAKLFIDTLEMIEAKTRGNLSQPEQNMLKQTLMTVRMAFVEAANESTAGATPGQAAPAAPAAAKPEPSSSTPAPEKIEAPREETHKKFTKKY
jgi:hypothetical protein